MTVGASRRLLGPEGPLARAFPGYEERSGQLDMADAVERALADDRTLLCEAGTGTGKTLAYLVPAILSGRKVVVSTATKALQEQILAKDLPLIAEHLGLDPQAALGKGLGNYLCLRRYHELRRSAGSLADAGIRRSLPLLEDWAADTETGDVSELVTLGEGDPIWREVSSSSDTRIGQNCAYYEDCFVTRMKRDLEQARVIVVNHALFFADLAVKISAAERGFAGAGALPPYDAVIFDEAHELESAATDFFGVRISRARVEALARDADRAFVSAGLADGLRARGEGTALTGPRARGGGRALRRSSPASARRAPRAACPSRPTPGSGDLADAYHRLDGALDIALQLRPDPRQGRGRAPRRRPRHGAARRRRPRGRPEEEPGHLGRGAPPLGHLRRVPHRPGGHAPRPRLRAHRRGGPHQRHAHHRSRREHGRPLPLPALAHGPRRAPQVPVDELTVPSPFDYATATILYTPRDLPEVNDAAFVPRAADRIAELVAVTGGGAFVLCTSNRAMRAFAAALRGKTPLPRSCRATPPSRCCSAASAPSATPSSSPP